MVKVYSPLTWGMFTEPPPDIPECGFVGELCPPSIRGMTSLPEEEMKESGSRFDRLCVRTVDGLS